APTTIALVLLPQLRGGNSIPTMKISPGTDRALFHLELESDEFKGYRLDLRNPTTNQIVWHSGLLHSRAHRETRVVSVTVPGALLEAGSYTWELTRVVADQRTEFVGSYTFQVER